MVSKRILGKASKKLKKIGESLISEISQTAAKKPSQFSEGFSPLFLKSGNGAFVKDLENNALLRNDIESLMKHRKLIKSKKSERDEINTLIEKDDNFAKNQNASFYVRIDSFSDSSIDMLVQTFTVTNEWEEFLKIKENLAVKIIEIVEKNNAGFAFPSQSLYFENFSNDKPEIFNPKSKK